MTNNQCKQINSSIAYVLTQGRALAKQTKRDYASLLLLSIKELDDQGFRLRKLNSLKQKHIQCLVSHWQEHNKSPRTIKNRLSALNYACQTLNKRNVVNNVEVSKPASNKTLPKNRAIHSLDINQIKASYIQASLALQQAFGLRREECIKIKPTQADEGNQLRLQGSWTKGGIERVIPISNDAQREALDKAKALAQDGSLIEKDNTYIQQRAKYNTITRQQGLKNLHGLRHAYAQCRYETLTHVYANGRGWQAPLAGGPSPQTLTRTQRAVDIKVRKQISAELGHHRHYIVKVYIG